MKFKFENNITGQALDRRLQMVQLLLKHGADIYVQDHWGNNALTDATLSESDKIYYSLLDKHTKLKETGSTSFDDETGQVVPPKAPSSVVSEPDTENAVLKSRQKSLLYYEWRATESGAANSGPGYESPTASIWDNWEAKEEEREGEMMRRRPRLTRASDIPNSSSRPSITQLQRASTTRVRPAASYKQELHSVVEGERLSHTSTSTTPSASPPVLLFPAELPVRSPRKLFIFIIQKNII